MKDNSRKLPAYPLFAKDPNFSIWTFGDELNQAHPKSWWGEDKPMYGFVKTEEGAFCFMGKYAHVKGCGVLLAEQTSVTVTAFTTDYEFAVGKGKLKVSFVSPLIPNDVELISLPACYLKFEVTGVKEAEVSLFVNRRICYNDRPETTDKSVKGGVIAQSGYETAFFGLNRQLYLSNNNDAIGADWGYFYVAGKEAFLTDEMGMTSYITGNIRDFSHNGEELYIAAIGGDSGRFAIAYDDIVAIDYFGSFKKTLYLENHSIFDAIEYVIRDKNQLSNRLQAFDVDLCKRAESVGEGYYEILTASLRQTIAAHKLVRDENGELLFLSKENHSNGCIATVDISYPSMPLFLIYNTELIKGMMRPILKFADLPVWKYDFAPHDAGTYPACCGQVYGLKGDGGKYHANYTSGAGVKTHIPIFQLQESFDAFDFNMQMPVEECANMLIMFAACLEYDNDLSFFREHKDVCGKWVEYLVKYGLKPENQLCTDDFAGHLNNNLNLSIKAIVGIGAYAKLTRAAGDTVTANKYDDIAKKYVDEVNKFAKKFEHTPLTWNSSEETFSLKYNLAFDKILKLNLFPQSLYESETDYYLEKSNEYGVPLDSRKNYTKSDWICWAASLTDNKEKKSKLISPLVHFLKTSPDRVPFSDWFETVDGKHHFFQARSVQGGCFILLL